MNRKIPLLITADSVCDLPEELIAQYNIVIQPYFVRTKEGRFVDGTEVVLDDLFIYMEQAENYAKSEPPEVEEYEVFFEKQLTVAEQILHITMAKNASNGYDHAVKAAEKCGNVTVFDSGQLSSGMGLFVIKAAQMAQEGATPAQILPALAVSKYLSSTSFIVRDTDFLHRLGRLSKGVKKLCDRMLLHPVLIMKHDSIVADQILVGQWTDVICRYIKYTLRRT